jgi:hypothetical protein
MGVVAVTTVTLNGGVIFRHLFRVGVGELVWPLWGTDRKTQRWYIGAHGTYMFGVGAGVSRRDDRDL